MNNNYGKRPNHNVAIKAPNRGSISAMLAKNTQAPMFSTYIDRCQGTAANDYVSKMSKVAMNPIIPLPPPPPIDTHPLISLVEKETKDKYVIGETKDEIINNIINKKASVANVRKALSKYSDIVKDQPLF